MKYARGESEKIITNILRISNRSCCCQGRSKACESIVMDKIICLLQRFQRAVRRLFVTSLFKLLSQITGSFTTGILIESVFTNILSDVFLVNFETYKNTYLACD